MDNLIVYFIQSGISLIILYLIYHFFLSLDTFHKLKRAYLLLSIFVSLLLPFFRINLPGGNPEIYSVILEPVVVTPENVATTISGFTIFSNVLSIIYFSGVLLFLGVFVFQLYKITSFYFKSDRINYEGIILRVLDERITPFSFHNMIFISRDTLDHPNLDKIVIHEQTHIRQFHSFDLLINEFLIILFWFNPVVWFYRKSFITVHEYLADETVIGQGHNKYDYQKLLLNQTLGITNLSFSNQFNQSLIKRRFIMMSKQKTNRIMLLKLVFVIPAALLITVLFTISFTNNVIAQTDLKGSNEKEVAVDVKEAQIPQGQDEPIFTLVEKMPEYPGGREAMMKYLKDNIKYPEEARKDKVQGTVFVTFVVEKNGKVTGTRILRGVNDYLDKEALRVVSSMPNWKPGMESEKPVRVQFNLPIYFKLNSEKEEEKKKVENQEPFKDVKKITKEKSGTDKR